jgi:chalcone isomerase-like protein
VIVAAAVAIVVAAVCARVAIAAPPAPMPPTVVAIAPGLHPLGKGSHSWFGVHLYDATLWVVGATWSFNEPHALELEAGRTITSTTLTSAAMDEMRGLKVGTTAERDRWSVQMARVMPPIRKGDRVVVFTMPVGKTVVFLNDTEHGEIDDPAFGQALFKIWLDPQSRNQPLRRKLLNQ